MNEITLDAHAKINLGLQIRGKYPDGYHRLDTILQRISLRDTVILKEAGEGIHLTSNSSDIPLDATNLVSRAAKKVLLLSGIDKGVNIHLEKRIPVGAGLGGGSSDAASVLTGLNALWGLDLGRETLVSMARELGADVPFFLYENCALGSGRGDRLTSINSPCRRWVALIYPGISIATSWVYARYRRELTKKRDYIKILRSYLEENRRQEMAGALHNDLEAVVFPTHPKVKALKRDLLREGAKGALMSGSGSSVFGLFDERDPAVQALEALKGKQGEGFLAEFIV